MTEKVKRKVEWLNSDLVLSGGRPPKCKFWVVVNKPFKEHFKKLYEEWLII